MADETTNVQPTRADVAAPTGEAPDASPKTTDDTPGFERESFSDFLEKTTKPPAGEAEVTDDTPDPEELQTKTDETKVEKPAEAAKPDEEEAVAEGDEPELLSDEEIDEKFKSAGKGIRNYAKQISKQYAPYAQVVDELGGIEAVKRLDKMATVALGVPDMKEGGNLDQFHDYVKSLNPEFLDAYNKKLFYSAIDDPKDAEALLTPYIQADERYKDLKFSDLKELADLVVDGEIDLEAIREKRDAERPEEAEKRRKQEEKDAADDAEKAELRSKVEAIEAEAHQKVIDDEYTRIWAMYQEKAAPQWKKFGLGPDFISDKDPQDIRDVKTAYRDDLNMAIGRRMAENPFVQDLARRCRQKEKGDGYAMLVDRCAHIYKGIVREEALKRQGLLSGYLKSYGQPVKDTKTRRPEAEVDARGVAHARTTEQEPEVREHEEGGLGKLIARKSQAA